jgi:iron complex outermembrane recepter protein
VKFYAQYSLLAVALTSFASSSSFAQQAPTEEPALEQVFVTAQKRVQSLQDVPISMSAISSEKIEKAGLTNIESMAGYVPSFNMTQTGIGTNIAIRGITSGVNQGFEQSTAMYVDGIHFGRAQLSRAPFLDIAQIEVLRGPQSILFGKNSTAGAISITTAKPSDEFEAKITALYEPEHDEQDVRLVVSGPLSDTFSARLAILDSQMDGYFDNTTLDQPEAQTDNQLIRLSLRWQPTDDWDINLKGEDSYFDSVGRNIEVIKAVFNPNPEVVRKDINGTLVSATTGLPVFSYARVLSQLYGGYQLDATQDFNRQSNGDFSNNDTNNFTFSVERDLGNHTLTAVTGYNAYEYEELCDCDFTGASGFNVLSNEEYSQFSQEIRFASDEDQTISYLTGIFYQTSELDFDDKVRVTRDSFIANGLSSSPLVPPGGAALLRGANTERIFDQDTDLWALFAQATWSITDSLRLIAGGRYTDETKEASRTQYHVDNTGVVLPQGTSTDPYNRIWSIFKVDPHSIKGTRDESAFTPLVTFQQDIGRYGMWYASYTTGFKSGGFDVRSNAVPDELGGIFPTIEGSWEFEDESVKNFEVGGKFILADGKLELNAAIFRSKFKDMQTSQFDGALSFNVTNAGEAVVKGLEMDGRWAALDNVFVRAGGAFIDFEYTKFPNSQCYFGQVDNIGSKTDKICDASGQRREFTPKYQGNAGVDYVLELGGGLKLTSTLDVIGSSEYTATPSLDPNVEQEDYTKINARIALSGNDDLWEVALIGKNLTDESILTYANGLPVSTLLTSDASTAYYAFYERPRSIALQGTLKF